MPIRRSLKRAAPEPEKRLWSYLRNRRLVGIKFRRQYSIGRYVVDFYCPTTRLAIEIDGDSHYVDDAPIQDRVRQQFIEDCNIRVMRFTNDEVMKNTEDVLHAIQQALRA